MSLPGRAGERESCCAVVDELREDTLLAQNVDHVERIVAMFPTRGRGRRCAGRQAPRHKTGGAAEPHGKPQPGSGGEARKQSRRVCRLRRGGMAVRAGLRIDAAISRSASRPRATRTSSGYRERLTQRPGHLVGHPEHELLTSGIRPSCRSRSKRMVPEREAGTGNRPEPRRPNLIHGAAHDNSSSPGNP